ncbi:peptidase family protein [Marinitoga piezophila KA3]|uniref:Peptidase family protein n=1 Tax=Marinitoga piezophila (strain DSM 14283 / JCM 11233 / KA3) TaxID=443254 RepID=H2J687_MARPK|nr:MULTISPECIES: M20/M25/M40 family metallo-hydrolase [Marinitoga]AEX86235.1 peptidase family protein [Marinitoga piezophila KA3]APT76646.1 peptidase M42 [Marinitoga sp. 1137]NUU98341.1 peptidase M42 [Marinitoga sp. 1138]
MKTGEILKDLSNAFGVSMYENPVKEKIIEYAKKISTDVEIFDAGKGSLGLKLGNGEKRFALFAHMDEIGIVITKIVDEQFAMVHTIGGVDPRTLISKRVKFKTENGEKIGVVGMLAPHLQKPQHRSSSPDFDNIYIDFSISGGTKDIEVGDIGTVDIEAIELNGKISGKALDNRVGCVVLLKTLEELKKFNLEGKSIYFLFNQGEEIGLKGAKRTAEDIAPEIGIVIDVTFGSDIPPYYEKVEMGKGPAIALGPSMHNEETQKMIDTAKKYGINHQLEPAPMRSGTESDIVQIVKEGVKTILISIPILNMHSSAEVVDPSDIDTSAILIANYIANYLEEGENNE